MSRFMGKLMALCVAPIEIDAVVHVPLHVSRRRERGYDQAALLARVTADSLHVPWKGDALKRTRRTAQQARLAAHERAKNVAGAFESRLPLHEERLLLIDDVSTTGATMSEAASALHLAGAGDITGLVFAKAL